MLAVLALTQVVTILFFSSMKKRMSPFRFDHFSVVELRQNVDDFLHVLKREPYLFCNFTLEIYLKWNINRLFLKWRKNFPEIIMFCKKLRIGTHFFDLDPMQMLKDIIIYCFIMERKTKKRPRKKVIFYLYTF